MWWRVGSVVLLLAVIRAPAAPAYPHTRGTFYTVNSHELQTRHEPFVEVRNATSHHSYQGRGPREEARALCSVRTRDANASANATLTRRLHGVVTSKELHSAIQRLEVVIFGQMQQVWRSVDALRAQLAGAGAGGALLSGAGAAARALYPEPDRHTVALLFKPETG